MDKINNRFTSIEQVASQYMTPARNNRETSGEKSASFQDILLKKQAQESGELKFSKHASHRLEERNISLTEEQSERLESGVKKADEKGIQESLVMMDSLAFIVNIPNKTVVTAMDQRETEENVFTNIDGAVII